MAGEDVLALNQQDRDRLKELHGVVRGQQKGQEHHLPDPPLGRAC
jgi:hypothetical protein